MDPQISPSHLAAFFAYAPLVLGLAILAVAWYAKRRENVAVAANVGTTFACASCGRRGARDHMLPRAQQGAVTWYCQKCGVG